MPRSKQYEVNEAFVSSSQSTILASPNDGYISEQANHVGAPPLQRKRPFTTGWFVGLVFACLCLAFILCVAFLEVPGVPTERTHSEKARALRKQGHLQVYPVPSFDKTSSRTNLLFLSNVSNLVQQLRDVLSDYPAKYTDSYTTCFVSVPTYNRPCYFEKEWFGTTCSEANNFGYKEVNGVVNPCILIRLENLTDWKPLIYSRNAVDKSWIENYDPNFSNLGCLTQSTQNRKDTRVNIYPTKGFPNQFFPASSFDKSLYLTPSVMIQVTGLQVGESIRLHCWLRVSNAYMLKDEGEVVINITVASTSTNSISPSVGQTTSMTTVTVTDTTTKPSTTPTKQPSPSGGINFSDVN